MVVAIGPTILAIASVVSTSNLNVSCGESVLNNQHKLMVMKKLNGARGKFHFKCGDTIFVEEPSNTDGICYKKHYGVVGGYKVEPYVATLEVAVTNQSCNFDGAIRLEPTVAIEDYGVIWRFMEELRNNKENAIKKRVNMFDWFFDSQLNKFTSIPGAVSMSPVVTGLFEKNAYSIKVYINSQLWKANIHLKDNKVEVTSIYSVE